MHQSLEKKENGAAGGSERRQCLIAEKFEKIYNGFVEKW